MRQITAAPGARAVMATLAAALAAGLALAPATRADVAEPKTGVKFPEKIGETSLTGIGLRTKTILKVKVYAIGLYVADSALAGSLKGKTGADLYRELVWGDFDKEIHLRLVRDVSASQMQESIREALDKADKARVDAFVAYFGDIKTGQEYVLHWAPGGTLETLAVGTPKPPIADKNFAAAVFGIWLGPDPIQDDVKRDLVTRIPELTK